MSELIGHDASGQTSFMASLLLEHQRLLSAEEFEAVLESGLFAGEHVELIQGRLTVLLAQGPRHVSHVDWLSMLFSERLAEAFGPRQRRVTVRVQSTSRFESAATGEGYRTTPEADLMLVQTEKALSGQALALDDVFLVVEVADTSLEKDLTEKARVYAALGVRLLWVLDLPHRRLHVFGEPDAAAGRYQETRALTAGDIRVDALPELSPFRVEELFLQV